MSTLVSDTPAAPPEEALARFGDRFRFETDCWDVHESLDAVERDFILVDARSPEAYEAGHVPGAVGIPHKTMTAERMSEYPGSTLFVVYCAGQHCNGAARAAVRLASLGFRVKEMLGGVRGWLDEGFLLEEGRGRQATPEPREPGKAVACGC